MPRRATSSLSSLSSLYTSASSSTSATPTDSSGEPLPVPTTLDTHTVGSRLLRSASRSSRTSRSSSTLTSRSSSLTRQAASIEPPQAEYSSISNGAGRFIRRPSTNGVDSDEGPRNRGRIPIERLLIHGLVGIQEPRRGRERRNQEQSPAYSSRDETDGRGDTSSAFDDSTSPQSSASPLKRKKRAPANKKGKTTKRRKLNNVRAIEGEARPSTLSLATVDVTTPEADVEIIQLPSEVISKESTVYDVESNSPLVAAAAVHVTSTAPVTTSEPLAEYSCPICFSPPMNATLTPCGHICCGECLFTAVRSAPQRAPPMPFREPNVARCPVCRAVLNGWDGRGGGVIGLKPRIIISL